MLPAISCELLPNGAIPNLSICNIDSSIQGAGVLEPHCMNHPNMRHQLEGNPVHKNVRKIGFYSIVSIELIVHWNRIQCRNIFRSTLTKFDFHCEGKYNASNKFFLVKTFLNIETIQLWKSLRLYTTYNRWFLSWCKESLLSGIQKNGKQHKYLFTFLIILPETEENQRFSLSTKNLTQNVRWLWFNWNDWWLRFDWISLFVLRRRDCYHVTLSGIVFKGMPFWTFSIC